LGSIASFAHRDLEEQGFSASHPRNVKCRRHPGFGPTVSPNKFWAVRSRRDTWRTIGLYRHFAYRDFEEQGISLLPAMIREDAKASRIRAHSIVEISSGPSDQGGTRGARLGSIATSPIVTLKNKNQPPPSRDTRDAKASRIRAHSIDEEVQGRPIKEGHMAHDWALSPLRLS
jgi:hypothetical protein